MNFYVLSFLLLPFAFPFFYFLAGMDKLNDELINKYKEELKKYNELERKILSSNSSNLAFPNKNELDRVFKYNYFFHQRPISTNNSIKFVNKSSEHISYIVAMIKRAKRFIHIEYYIFAEGYVFNHLTQLLFKKIQEGVEVKLIVDGWGNYRKISSKMIKRLKNMGIQYKVFNPLFTRKNELWWNFRNHNKLLVVDNEFALLGSCNISDEYFNITDKFFPTNELSIFIEGEIVNSLNLLFTFHWAMIKSNQREFDILLNTNYYFPKPKKKFRNNISIQLINSSPLMENQPIKTNILQLIFSAKKSIKISTPYFYPSQDVVNALKIAGKSGIKVQIILPKEADLNDRILRVHRELLSTFLYSNIEIYEYFGFNHEKFTLIDEEIIYFGTSNWDYRSFYWNFESALIIKNKENGAQINKLFEINLANSHRLLDKELEIPKRYFPNVFISVARWCQALS